MTNPLSAQTLTTYLPQYDVVPDKWEDARPFFVEALKRISNAVNAREIASFLDTEVLTGGQFIPGINTDPTQTPNQYRDILRIVVDTGTLPNAGTITIPHTIGGSSGYGDIFSLINLYLSATDPVGLTSFSLQYWSITGGDITINLTNTDIVITTISDYSSYTRSYCTIEYLQQV